MKTLLISSLLAPVGLLAFLAGSFLDAANFLSFVFATAVAAWTFAQYGRRRKPLVLPDAVVDPEFRPDSAKAAKDPVYRRAA